MENRLKSLPMLFTVLNIDGNLIWEGAKVKNLRTNKIRIVRVLGKEQTVSEAIKLGLLNPDTDIDYETFWLNKNKFELIEEI